VLNAKLSLTFPTLTHPPGGSIARISDILVLSPQDTVSDAHVLSALACFCPMRHNTPIDQRPQNP
jgi:hypothetical protein